MSAFINRAGWLVAGVLGLLVVAALAGIVQGGPLDPPRPPGSTQANLIYQPADCAGFPIVLSSAGSYVLAENIIMPAACAKNGLEIAGSEVSLDLKGFTVEGVAAALTGIKADNGPVAFTLENGTIAGWPAGGLDTRGASDSRISHVEVTQNGPVEPSGGQIEIGNSSTLSDCVASTSGGSAPGALGILVDGSFGVVDGCLVYGNSGQGLKVLGGYNRITNNHLSNNDLWPAAGCADLWIYGGNNVVEDNTAIAYFNDTCPIYIDSGAVKSIVHRNVARNGTPNYTNLCLAGCDIGPIGTSATSTSPWANISD